jgi:amidophosphoribosyltransferase
LIDADLVREIEPGEMVVIGPSGLRSYRPFPQETPAQCIFEYVYFSRPDSVVYGRSVHEVRKRLGRELAKEQPADADVVVPVPDSGVYAALGYSDGAKLPLEFGLVRNHYVGRTFIEPRQSIRHFGVKLKLNPVRTLLEGKRVVLIDDSIVRGTTSRKIVSMVRAAGAKEVHMRISCAPTIGPCYYGVDTPNRSELIAATHSVEEIGRFIEADSLGYLSLEGMQRAVGSGSSFCTSCYTNEYPVALPEREQVRILTDRRK